jgi:cytochrome c biogenesis protein CcmG/thiol:disulfide interchange protein DsbE
VLFLPGFLPPPPPNGQLVAIALAVAAALPMFGFALRATARRVPAGEGASAAVTLVFLPRTRSRVAASVLAAALGAGLFVNGGFSAHNLEALRPIGRGKTAPAFSLPRIDGEPGNLALGTLRGHVVLLDFWASWCAPCVKMMPTLHQLYGEWRSRGVEFVGINSDGPGASVEQFRSLMHAHSYPMVIDTDGEVGDLYKLKALPHMVLVGADGTVRRTFSGYTAKAELAAALAEAVR